MLDSEAMSGIRFISSAFDFLLPQGLERPMGVKQLAVNAITAIAKFRRTGISDEIRDDANAGKLAYQLAARYPAEYSVLEKIDTAREMLVDFHFMCRWARFGLPVFKLTKPLAVKLLMTNPGALKAEEILPPFPSFVVEMPRDLWLIEDRQTQRKQPIEIIEYHKFYDCEADSNGSHDRISISSMTRHRTVILTRGDWVSDPVDRWCANTKFQSLAGPLCSATPKDEAGVAPAVRRLMVNLIMFINAFGMGHKLRVRRGARVKKKATSRPTPEVWVLGKKIKLCSPDLEQAAAACIGTTKQQRAAWRLKSRFTVRGHWRMQACGRARAERKRRWIEPYWKGPTGAEKLAHIYEEPTNRKAAGH